MAAADSAMATLSAAWMKGPGMSQSSTGSLQVVALGGAAVLVASAAAAAYAMGKPLFGRSKTDEQSKEALPKETEKDAPRAEPRNAFSSIYRVASEAAPASYDAAATATDSVSATYDAASADCASSVPDKATEGISVSRSVVEKAAEPLPRNPLEEFFENIGKGFDDFGQNVERTITGKDSNKSNDMTMVVYSRPKENPAAEFFDNVGKGFMGMFGA